MKSNQNETKLAFSSILFSLPQHFLCNFSINPNPNLIQQQQQHTRNAPKALKIINFRVPAYVPITLPAQHQLSPSLLSAGAKAAPIDHPYHPLDLAKPILMDCDYQYDPEEDARLTVKWFKNKEPEPFYQWLPELDARYFADWIRPLVELDFVSDPHDPLKRYRSLLFKRLSMNLTGQYTCLVTSLASQDQRQSSLIVFQPPRSFTFEHRIFPPPSLVAPGRQQPPMALSGASQLVPPANSQQAANNVSSTRQQPTQFKNLASGQQQLQQPKRAGTIRPPNNNATVQVAAQASSIPQNPLATSQANVHNQSTPAATKIVYTHDGRPIAKRPSDKTKRQIPSWMLDKKAAPLFPANPLQTPANPLILGPQPTRAKPRYAIQLHHFLCRATHLTPRPVMVLMVKRDPDSIAQYLHESSSVSIRPFQVNHFDYFESVSANGQQLAPSGVRNETSSSNSLLVTLYDITVSATIALNVTLPPASPTGPNVEPAEHSRHEPKQSSWPTAGGLGLAEQQQQQATSDSLITTGINTILHFHPNQRMSFECHLEITATEFEQRKRIFITPDGK